MLLECGLFQVHRHETYERNQNFCFDPASTDAMVLSHAHIDHSGNIPNFVKHGFPGPIHATQRRSISGESRCEIRRTCRNATSTGPTRSGRAGTSRLFAGLSSNRTTRRSRFAKVYRPLSGTQVTGWSRLAFS